MTSSQQAESKGKLTRERPSGHAASKHRLINVDRTPVLIRSALKQHYFNFSRIAVVVYVTVLSESTNSDAVLLVIVTTHLEN